MGKTQRVRHLRHRRLGARGLFRGSDARRRLRHFESWLDRLVGAIAARGGLAGTASAIAVTAANATDDFAATAHGLRTGQRVLLTGSAPPAGLALSGSASSVLTFTNQPADGDTVSIDGMTYVFRAASLGSRHRLEPGAVKIGATLAASITNLAAAIRGDGAGNVRATANLGVTTLPGDSTTLTIGAVVYTFRTNPGPSATAPNAVDVKIAGSIDDQIGALAAAINGADGYVAHPLVRATPLPATNQRRLEGLDLGTAANLTVSQSAAHFSLANVAGGAETHAEVTLAHDTCGVRATSGTMLTAEARDDLVPGARIALAETSANASWAGASMTGGGVQPYFVIATEANRFALAATREAAHAGLRLLFTTDGTALSVTRVLTRESVLALLRRLRSDTVEAASDVDTL